MSLSSTGPIGFLDIPLETVPKLILGGNIARLMYIRMTSYHSMPEVPHFPMVIGQHAYH